MVQKDQPPFQEIFKITCRDMKNSFPDHFGANLDELADLVDSDEHLHYVYTVPKNMGLPEVFCHGDFHGGNMIFQRDPETGQATDQMLAIVDWQVKQTNTNTTSHI